MSNRPSFFADDALAYAESYKSLVSKNLQQITQLKQEFETKFWDGTNSDHFYYVKLRSFEHALAYKETGRTPDGMVIIGDAPKNQDTGLSVDEEKVQALEEEARQFSEAVKNMQSELKKSQAREVSLRGEIIQREQAIKRLQRQITNTQGSYAVLISAIIIGVALAFWL
jgi:thiol:disulfide interchange protein